jgi:hypothetical protein
MPRLTAVAIVLVTLLGLALAGCKKKEGPAGDDCAVAVDHMMSVQLAELSKDMDAKTKAQATAAITAAKANLIASCKQTKWSKDATDCIKAVKNDDDAAKCDEKLTKEQRDAAEKVVDVDTEGPAGSDGTAGSAAAAAGSAAAGSGSGAM